MNKNNLFGIGIVFAVLLVFTAPVMAVECGDANADGNINIGDVGLIRNHWQDPDGYPVSCCDDDNVLEYSVTIIEDYSDSPWLGDLDRGQESYDKLVMYLRDAAHWTEKFHEMDDSVDEPDFGTSNSGYQGLDEADFYYHFGHGYDDIGTEICLHNWLPGWNYADVRAQDVEYKWDEDTEWVVIHSCVVLDDHDDWEHALKYSHAAMGFETDVYMHEALIYYSSSVFCNFWSVCSVELRNVFGECLYESQTSSKKFQITLTEWYTISRLLPTS